MHSYFSRLSAVFGFTFTVLACLLFATAAVDPFLRPAETPVAEIEIHNIREMHSGRPSFSLQAGTSARIILFFLMKILQT